MGVAFQTFELEQIMSDWEQVVDYNLSESGAHPVKVKALIAYDSDILDRMLETELGYGYANGSPELREAITQYYPGATVENVLVTVGCVEANYITLQTLLEDRKEVAIQVPCYLQGWGLAHNLGAVRKTFELDPDRGRGVEPRLAQFFGRLLRRGSEQTQLLAQDGFARVFAPEDQAIGCGHHGKRCCWARCI